MSRSSWERVNIASEYPTQRMNADSVRGMAWTEVGGELLVTEVAVLPGKGKLTVTGKLGEVMQESASAAMSYVRSRSEFLEIDPKFYETKDIHTYPRGCNT